MRKQVRKIATDHKIIDLLNEITHLREEKKAIDERLATLEQSLCALAGRLPAEGTTYKIIGGRKVKFVTRLRRNLDQRKARVAYQELPEHVRDRVLPVQHKLSVRELKYLEEHDPSSFAVVRRTFTTAHGKPTITIMEE